MNYVLTLSIACYAFNTQNRNSNSQEHMSAVRHMSPFRLKNEKQIFGGGNCSYVGPVLGYCYFSLFVGNLVSRAIKYRTPWGPFSAQYAVTGFLCVACNSFPSQ